MEENGIQYEQVVVKIKKKKSLKCMLYLYLLHFYYRVIFYAERNQNLNAFFTSCFH